MLTVCEVYKKNLLLIFNYSYLKHLFHFLHDKIYINIGGLHPNNREGRKGSFSITSYHTLNKTPFLLFINIINKKYLFKDVYPY
jgi:hypothetical protein